MSDENVTIEDLQKQIADLKKADETKTAEIEALRKKSDDATDALAKARDLNARLLLENPSAGSNDAGEENEDTIESVCEEIVKACNERYLKRFANGN